VGEKHRDAQTKVKCPLGQIMNITIDIQTTRVNCHQQHTVSLGTNDC
jgi:hypothetical protein